jgi:AbrB family looped-hinge helix DNA binding protein
MTINVDQKGRVALPAEVLRDGGVQPGDELVVSLDDKNIILKKVTPVPTERLVDILRALKGLPLPERSRNAVRAN